MLHSRHLCRQLHTAARRIPLAYELHRPPTSNASTNHNDTTTRPIVFLHGFLGSKRENRHVSRVLAKDLSRPVYALDMRNHGESGHHPKHDYMEMALDVKYFIERHQLRSPTVIGHSMGAKTALTLSLESPTLVKDVVAIDNCPIRLPLESDFARYLEGLARLGDERITDYSQADRILTPYEKSPAIRAWLISNLHKKPDTPFLQLRVPVETLSTAIRPLGEFPYRVDEGSEAIRQFNGLVLFLRALQSNFIPESALPLIKAFFPSSELVDIDCGHWIVQEKPEEFRKIVGRFLLAQEN
ncbi:alpha/beta-hydrolase [Aspergillus eucalypticola CBS 122712]|uniref:Alpha/beta-hydrolase n=1 Tax=Aspergillus eucalypticola (strain CBS 122712 / IBT 29274) TaxID=1448314 RepID=A0A317W540_ASPEC|nr:alpha/beta-hydrolase [Aspergillus eucalypticola CBS 122712]PWY80148.1 alpha/beta-hydrolase [Aspergillus eucalypticola CBS 122712]